ncbi:MAG: AbrB family transcriptional regulator [Gammaproteobacteria bacterium]|jgi:AbrB family looped-hinge helix DNA binding protein|nr:AbrB family transcriptional regulator [Gammaproteobacteria bacterium]HJP18884.1 AbrB/MazE/SpoVT family DNA-binding domain-containing protein [Nitrospinota bacterium]|tara:strand:- start:5146 stop:5379 length:234 start_codon:yes stop_codon:yes gene_type:complete
MKSAITSKYQTTIPKNVRLSLKISANDALEWTVESGKAIVSPVKKPFLKYRNTIETGPGNIADDIKLACLKKIKKYK